MERPVATHERPRVKAHVRRGACVRVGLGGTMSGQAQTRAFWLTLAEAELLRIELDAAITRARNVGMPPATTPPRERPDPPAPATLPRNR
jgi:hypothetical protein